MDIQGLKVYAKGQCFEEWWKDFKYYTRALGINKNEIQLKYSLLQYLDEDINKYIKNLTLNEELTIERVIIAALTFYDTDEKTQLDYEKEFMSGKKEIKETVASYYLRLQTLALKAKVDEKDERFKQVYLNGLEPKGLYVAVLRRTDNESSISQIHQAAIKEERDHLKAKKKDIIIDEKDQKRLKILKK